MLSPGVDYAMSPHTRVAVFVRRSVPFQARSRQLAVLGRVRALESAGVVDEVVVDTWANRVTDATADAAVALAAFEGFETWAKAHRARLEPGFEAHDCHCTFTDRDYRATVFPVVCVAVYADDELVAVYPHTRDDGSVVTVDLGLSLLEAGDDTRSTPEAGPNAGPEPPAA